MYRRFGSKKSKSRETAEDQKKHEQEVEEETKADRDKLIEQANHQYVDQFKSLRITKTLKQNNEILLHLFKDSSDIVLREFEIEKSVHALAVFVDGLVDTAQVNMALKALMIEEGIEQDTKRISFGTMPSSQITEVDNYADLLQGVLSGDTALLIEGNTNALLLGLRGPTLRSIAEPETEAVVRGPREGYIESIRTNTSLLRRKLKTPHLKMKPMVVGRHSNTNLVVAYLDGVVDPATLEEVIKRIEKIEIDGVLESGYIEEMIQDNTHSPFPQVQYTERPDVTAAALLEGRIAIMVDGTPFVLIVPTTFWQLMQANEDYYERYQMATMIRWLRYIFLIVAITTPSLYIAITTFHHALVPTTLLISTAAARENIPFPAVVEAFIMEIAFEALREAGVRLPKTVGQAVSILGALVVGQAAVQAGIVSAPMVIVVSITGIASFTIPRYNAAIAIRMLRFPLMVLASIFGLYGVILGLMLILGHMANLRSFGIPYLSPVSPLSYHDLKDTVIRAPWWAMEKRPEFMPVGDTSRVGKEFTEDVVKDQGQSGALIEHERKQGGEEQT